MIVCSNRCVVYASPPPKIPKDIGISSVMPDWNHPPSEEEMTSLGDLDIFQSSFFGKPRARLGGSCGAENPLQVKRFKVVYNPSLEDALPRVSPYIVCIDWCD